MASNDHEMNYPADFINELKTRSGSRCECERRDCHGAEGRCRAGLLEEGGIARWTPVLTGERLTFPPIASNYIALCAPCSVPRAGARA